MKKVLILGGGFAGNLNDSSAVRGGPGFELTFFALMDQPGKRLGPKALSMLTSMFNSLNIHQHFGKKIKMFETDGVVFEDDSKLEADFTMFIPAGDGHQVIKNSDLPTNAAGFVKTDDFSCVLKDDGTPSNIYAIGDIAALEGYDWRAKQGHVAEVMAKNALLWFQCQSLVIGLNADGASTVVTRN